MMWKRLLFKYVLCLGMVNLAAHLSARTESKVEEALGRTIEQSASRHERNVAQWQRRWLSLIPNIGTVQYAGNIGMGSIGFGWDYGKNDRWETLVLLGFVPKYHTEQGNVTFTLRENLVPWSIGLGTRRWAQPHNATYTGSTRPLPWNRRAFASFEPMVFTTSLSTIFNNQFWVKEPEKYNGGDYYRFSSKVRLHLGVGSRLRLNIPNPQRRHFDRISFYYELSTYDLAIISAVPNEKLTLGDILCLGIGLQYKFF